MNGVLALLVGLLFACGTYLLLQRTLTRVVIGFALLGHGANLLLLAAGGRGGAAPLTGPEGPPAGAADPLPQALALTAIVISFALLVFLLALAHRSHVLTNDDAVADDVEDRVVARRTARAVAQEERPEPVPETEFDESAEDEGEAS